jgi:hypothetical protein
MLRWISAATAAALVGGVSAGLVYGQEAGKDKKQGERARPNAEQIFKRLDTNNDGKLVLDEFLKSPRVKDEAKGKEMFNRLSKGKDAVTLEEFKKAFEQRGDRGRGGEGGRQGRRPGGRGKAPQGK